MGATAAGAEGEGGERAQQRQRRKPLSIHSDQTQTHPSESPCIIITTYTESQHHAAITLLQTASPTRTSCRRTSSTTRARRSSTPRRASSSATTSSRCVCVGAQRGREREGGDCRVRVMGRADGGFEGEEGGEARGARPRRRASEMQQSNHHQPPPPTNAITARRVVRQRVGLLVPRRRPHRAHAQGGGRSGRQVESARRWARTRPLVIQPPRSARFGGRAAPR